MVSMSSQSPFEYELAVTDPTHLHCVQEGPALAPPHPDVAVWRERCGKIRVCLLPPNLCEREVKGQLSDATRLLYNSPW